jgi:hypothetical protein
LFRLTKDTKRYAKLLLSVGRQGRGITQKQPLSPVECAEDIKRLMDEENKNLIQVSEMLDLGRPEEGSSIYKKRDTSQVNNFLKLLNVSEKSRDFAGWGWEGYPKIPFTTISKLSTLTHDEQDKILQSAYKDKKKQILVKDVIKILKWRRENPKISIDECIEKILKLKPVTVVTHIVVCETYEKLKNFIKTNADFKQKILDILRDNLEGEFYEIDATDILITISMNETAYKIFHEQQYKKGVHFTEFLNTFLEDRIV